ncbi:hypothetical protein Acr_07g0011940 [Actinidia rufa]|uniref:Uncharacterized protein n=1 Tax=Actinidia rufa TaxID=165716 RepID=A0A7J0EX65_9ERIC|nr:hypothetical protein Acr_07g0011940 [Actinidia rufa]
MKELTVSNNKVGEMRFENSKPKKSTNHASKKDKELIRLQCLGIYDGVKGKGSLDGLCKGMGPVGCLVEENSKAAKRNASAYFIFMEEFTRRFKEKHPAASGCYIYCCYLQGWGR